MSEASEYTSLVDLIDQLAEVPDMPPVSMMPQTQGWIVVAAIAVMGLILALRRVLRWRRATAYRRAALRALDHAGDDPVAISAILKRAALVVYPRDRVAPLSGDDWLRFLDATGGETGFLTGPGRVLAEAAYRSGGAGADPALTTLARRWLRRQGPGAAP